MNRNAGQNYLYSIVILNTKMIGWVSILVFLTAVFVAAQNPKCGSTSPLSIKSKGVFGSPNYPRRYSGGLDCTWTFEASSNLKIYLECDPLDIPCASGDFIIVSPSGDSNFLDAEKPVCGKVKLETFSTGNTLSLKFNSKKSTSGGVFSCIVTPVSRTFSTTGPSTLPTTPRTTLPTTPRTTKPPTTLRTTPQPICQCGTREYVYWLRIAGGQEASITTCPWQVMINEIIPSGADKPGRQFCGGTLISSFWVITAAHCTDKRNANTMLVITGQENLFKSTPDTQMILVARIVQHPNYRRSTVDNDISLLLLRSPVVLSKTSYPICLPSRFVNYNFDNEHGEATGWGTAEIGGESSSELRQVSLPILSTKTCKNNNKIGSKITDNMFCTYHPGKDTCTGDSGGPLSWEDRKTERVHLVGIVSFGVGCNQIGFPGVYTKVTNYLDWIQQSTGVLCSA